MISIVCKTCQRMTGNRSSSVRGMAFNASDTTTKRSRQTSLRATACRSARVQEIVTRQESNLSSASTHRRPPRTYNDVEGTHKHESVVSTTNRIALDNIRKMAVGTDRHDVVSSTADLSAPPEPPTECCMSGCANCVWIKYIEELLAFYKEEGIDKAKEAVKEIDDVNVRTFVKLELGI